MSSHGSSSPTGRPFSYSACKCSRNIPRSVSRAQNLRETTVAIGNVVASNYSGSPIISSKSPTEGLLRSNWRPPMLIFVG